MYVASARRLQFCDVLLELRKECLEVSSERSFVSAELLDGFGQRVFSALLPRKVSRNTAQRILDTFDPCIAAE